MRLYEVAAGSASLWTGHQQFAYHLQSAALSTVNPASLKPFSRSRRQPSHKPIAAAMAAEKRPASEAQGMDV